MEMIEKVQKVVSTIPGLSVAFSTEKVVFVYYRRAMRIIPYNTLHDRRDQLNRYLKSLAEEMEQEMADREEEGIDSPPGLS